MPMLSITNPTRPVASANSLPVLGEGTSPTRKQVISTAKLVDEGRIKGTSPKAFIALENVGRRRIEAASLGVPGRSLEMNVKRKCRECYVELPPEGGKNCGKEYCPF